ncbi:branched-chain amino acid ABC transporter permease [Bradyrhizobium sediminis]|uniref:Branched-chain amino acid ABC transporter permease n=1 Tax=Bradyrhizobium sediminis TaxID=2840469 RepID=A0A975NEG5_9BRAD|nr:branched-chain amino acid ABC transporter permease [Bradyrhizobium sediminis]QWG13076.1 branched-chain amino acid ABC transporter permease [Bradyrhizobium sediminis]
MIPFIQTTLDGLMVGSSYGLLALGFALIFGVMRRLNLSYGPSIMVGAYLGTLLYIQFGAPTYVVAMVAVAGSVMAGVYVERLCFAPLGLGAGVASMVSSFAIWMQLEQASLLMLPRHSYPFPSLTGGELLSLGPFTVRPDYLIMLAAMLAIMAALNLLLYRTRFGLGLRAIVENSVAASLSGIDVQRTMLKAFMLASAIGGVAGFLVLSANQQVTAMLGMWATLKGLIAMMIGGLGSIPGAIVGGLVLGVIEVHSQGLFGPQVRDLAAYGVLFVLLVLRPGGILGTTAIHGSMGRRGGDRWTTT